MCANVGQGFNDRLLFLESTTVWQTTKIDTISGLHFGVLQGHTPYTPYVYLGFASEVALEVA